ncbi:cobyric acid synthase [Afifella marina DSM 2698]|uniref:Cobyric acid synthase n=2 Tax=Afifella marina TaxID=1080 RepID=A0A1G5P7B1_AFIMA|nr:cobyric acid synthase [Afifella marina DSM 2698]MBK1628480.1 cobyric acid synthase [Afifella marina]MBK5917967.1 cobyric acid synthase CobQ [Afifella marina]RAI18697.1 cobyric acid synthase CobQ [Afifella marina DSM 2698]SCZ45395.1 adenosylcobyric acid synthase (glutamine-hydrolysing) [Afifella marina DSM 2698]
MSRTPAIMIQGTGSHVGKSLLVAGLCRAFSNRGLKVRPFKPQNMSNNAGVTADGGEIGRAQMTQALAARVPPSVHMNPVLLKPESDIGAQVIVQGRRVATLKARDYTVRKPEFLAAVMDSFNRQLEAADIVVVEGAGSPAEVNLREGDIANMGFALAADVPVILAGDIERGGVIASLVGSHAILDAADRSLIKAFIVNRFRGDVTLFDEGMRIIEERTGWAGLGVVPHFPGAAKLPAEDVLGLEEPAETPKKGAAIVKVVVPRLGRIANFDDLDPLRQEPAVELVILEPGEALPGNTDLVLLPGSKSTIADLAALREAGWDIDIAAHVRRGGHVIGICGGFQMLGRLIADKDGIEGAPQNVRGLGLLDVTTNLTADKTTVPVRGVHMATGAEFSGYEIHVGETVGPGRAEPFAKLEGHPDGAVAYDGRVMGTYAHGLFGSDAFRGAFLANLGATSSTRYDEGVEEVLDALAQHLEEHLPLDHIFEIAASRGSHERKSA